MLKNLGVLGKFPGIKQPTATTWLTKISDWIHLSKDLESDLWDVVPTHMIGGALTRINTKLRTAKELALQS